MRICDQAGACHMSDDCSHGELHTLGNCSVAGTPRGCPYPEGSCEEEVCRGE